MRLPRTSRWRSPVGRDTTSDPAAPAHLPGRRGAVGVAVRGAVAHAEKVVVAALAAVDVLDHAETEEGYG